MESYSNGIVEDEMINSLSFKIDPTANYVTDRKSVTYQAQGSDIYTPGNSVVKFNITGTGQYLDPSTVRFVYTLKNKDTGLTKNLYPLSGPWGFFRRCRIYSGAGGAPIEDIDYANKVHEMLSLLTAKHARDNDTGVEGFGDNWCSDRVYESRYAADTNPANFRLRFRTSIGPGETKTVSFKPMFGILNQPKFIPIQWLPLSLEFEVVSSATDPIVSTSNNSQFLATNTSTSWEITNCMIKADVVELDSAVHNEYASHLMRGNPIPINYTSFIMQSQLVASHDFSVNITRSCSRLKTVFVSFGGEYPTSTDDETTKYLIRKDWNAFYHPMLYEIEKSEFDKDEEVQIQLLVGNKTFPVFPIRSAAEAYTHLKKALGIHGSSFHSLSIDTIQKYCYDHFIVAFDTEKVLGASFSGINCRQDLISISVKPANGNSFVRRPTKVWVAMQTDNVVEIRETGSLVID